MLAAVIEWSPQWVAVGLSAAALACSAGAWWYTLYDRRRKETEKRLDALEQQLAMIDVTIKALPTSIAWGEMQRDIAGIRGDWRTTSAHIDGLGAGLKRVERQIGLLMEHELRGRTQT